MCDTHREDLSQNHDKAHDHCPLTCSARYRYYYFIPIISTVFLRGRKSSCAYFKFFNVTFSRFCVLYQKTLNCFAHTHGQFFRARQRNQIFRRQVAHALSCSADSSSTAFVQRCVASDRARGRPCQHKILRVILCQVVLYGLCVFSTRHNNTKQRTRTTKMTFFHVGVYTACAHGRQLSPPFVAAVHTQVNFSARVSQ